MVTVSLWTFLGDFECVHVWSIESSLAKQKTKLCNPFLKMITRWFNYFFLPLPFPLRAWSIYMQREYHTLCLPHSQSPSTTASASPCWTQAPPQWAWSMPQTCPTSRLKSWGQYLSTPTASKQVWPVHRAHTHYVACKADQTRPAVDSCIEYQAELVGRAQEVQVWRVLTTSSSSSSSLITLGCC